MLLLKNEVLLLLEGCDGFFGSVGFMMRALRTRHCGCLGRGGALLGPVLIRRTPDPRKTRTYINKRRRQLDARALMVFFWGGF